jgi:endonuclease YncB( thermonuclease family)
VLAALVAEPSPAEMPVSEPACTLQAAGTHAVVRVIDSETVLLDDTREVRLIGALAPRAPDMRPDAPDWPPEAAAIEALSALVLGRPVELAYAGRRRDRYGRLLAHLFIDRDDGGAWVQGELLKGGHARAYGLPGNFACMREMLAHERVARAAGAGLWSNGAYRTRSAQRPGALMRYRNTYQVVEGRLAHVAPTKSRTYLNFGTDWRRDFTAGIDASVLRANPEWAKTLAALEGRRVEVRGWIEYRNGPYVNVEDPSQIAVDEEGAPSKRGGPTMSRGERRDRPVTPKQERPAPSGPGALDL